MSVLNQSGEEQVECPLCMEPLEVDDLNFYPCTCGYQICRFCWHRIRTDENGLCPACRKAYSENPADFIPLSQEQVAKLKAEKRQRDQQRKAKLSENRKHLASVRVVQRNLVFVVGLPVRLADPEVLKRHEYFGKFGKIHKVVINQSTSYAGSQGPSASAYVTYLKSDDALRAIQNVNNITIDGRLIKSSLGTTKYCSHFLKNQTCPKADCMYLHDYDPEASFTKEEMHAGKHQEYEKKLHESLVMRNNTNNNNNSISNHYSNNNHQVGTTTSATTTSSDIRNTSSAPIPTGMTVGHSIGNSKFRETNGLSSSVGSSSSSTSSSSERDKREKDKNKTNKAKSGNTDGSWKERKDKSGNSKTEIRTENGIASSKSEVKDKSNSPSITENDLSSSEQPQKSPSSSPSTTPTTSHSSSSDCHLNQLASKLPSSVLDDNTSFFSSNSFQKLTSTPSSHIGHNHNHIGENEDDIGDTTEEESHPANILTDTLPNINTTEDWAAAFGFPRPAEPDVLGKRERNTPRLDSFRNGFGPLRQDHEFSKGPESYNGFYDIPSKVQENILDLLSSNTTKKNGFIDHTRQQQRVLPIPTTNSTNKPLIAPPNVHVHDNNVIINGLDENMSKFFMNFHKNYKELNSTPTPPVIGQPQPPQQQQPDFPNGFNGIHHNNFFSGFANQADRLVMLQQKQMEDQFLNLSLKQGFGNNVPNPLYQNGLSQNSYINGENGSGFGHIGGHGGGLYGNGTNQIPSQKTQNIRSTNEDDLGFDPFQETQKAFAELMASEQNHKLHNTGRNQMNGVVYNNGSHLPPPPPGFVQSNPHMNSFGSKILPYLNMSSSPQQINSQTQNSWPTSNYNSQLQPQQPQNSTTNTCNDWKVLDPAILTSSQHYPLANMSTIRDYTNLNQQQQLQNGPSHLRSYDYNTNNAFANAFTQLQPNINSFAHLNQPQNHLNWFTTTDLNSQISSPPGFRANQTTKQQEC